MHVTDMVMPNQDYFFKINSFTKPHGLNNRLLTSDWSEPITSSTIQTAPETDVWVNVSSLSEGKAINVSDHIIYSIRVGNAGSNDLNGVLLKHNFPIGLSSSSLSYQCQVIQGTANCPTQVSGSIDYLLDLPAGSILEFTVDGYAGTNNTGMLYMSTIVSPPDGVNDINIENNSDYIHFDWIFTNTFETLQ